MAGNLEREKFGNSSKFLPVYSFIPSTMWESAPTINRQLRRPLLVVKRHVSSNASKPAVSQRSLPPAKTRALISLYHQSKSFITPENLSARIDEAFLNEDQLARISSPNAVIQDLRRLVVQRKTSPRMGIWEDHRHSPYRQGQMSSGWSGGGPFRDRSVVEALYGVDKGGMPGLDVLEESGDRIQSDIAEDLKSEEQSEEQSEPWYELCFNPSTTSLPG
jgi:hypothetical protein